VLALAAQLARIDYPSRLENLSIAPASIPRCRSDTSVNKRQRKARGSEFNQVHHMTIVAMETAYGQLATAGGDAMPILEPAEMRSMGLRRLWVSAP